MVPRARRAACRAGPRGHVPDAPPVATRGVGRRSRESTFAPSGRRMELYREADGDAASARLRPRRLLAPAAPWRRYDVVHTGSMPYFSLLAALAAAPARELPALRRLDRGLDPPLLAEYAGRLVGGLGLADPAVRRADAAQGVRVRSPARRAAPRARAQGEVTILDGLYAGDASPPREPEPVVVFAGRHIPEKRVPSLVPAWRRRGSGSPSSEPSSTATGRTARRCSRCSNSSGLNGSVSAPRVRRRRAGSRRRSRRALCFVLPSQREGYGLVVVEAAAAGTPSVVVAHPDNAAVELVDDGENGVVVESRRSRGTGGGDRPDPRGRRGVPGATREWYARNEQRLSIESSVDKVVRRLPGRTSSCASR